MMQRRDALKGAAFGVLVSSVSAQESTGPFSLPTAKFDKDKQFELPPTAFQINLLDHPLLVPRPTAIGTYQELMEGELKTKAFGPGDKTPIGECFHGVAREWVETPPHWKNYGCDPTKTGSDSWEDKKTHFGQVDRYDGQGKIQNWGEFPIKCYKFPAIETYRTLLGMPHPTRFYSYGGRILARR